MDENTVNSIDSDQHIDDKLELDGIKNTLDEKDLANTRLQDTSPNATGSNSLPCTCNLDPKQNKAARTR